MISCGVRSCRGTAALVSHSPTVISQHAIGVVEAVGLLLSVGEMKVVKGVGETGLGRVWNGLGDVVLMLQEEPGGPGRRRGRVVCSKGGCAVVVGLLLGDGGDGLVVVVGVIEI